MSVWNAEQDVGASIESILRQTLHDFEFLIVDDASTDGTGEILRRYAKHDQRIRLFLNTKNKGQAWSAQRAMEAARGAYIARQDADDSAFPRRLEEEVSFLESHPHMVAVCANWEWWLCKRTREEKTETTHLTESPHCIAWRLLFSNYLACQSAFLFRRDAALAVGGYHPAFCHTEDYDLWLRLLSVGDISVVPHVLERFRRGLPQSMSRKHSLLQRQHVQILSGRALQALTGMTISQDVHAWLMHFWNDQRRREALDTVLLPKADDSMRAVLSPFLDRLGKHALAMQRQIVYADIGAEIAQMYARWSECFLQHGAHAQSNTCKHYAELWQRRVQEQLMVSMV